MIELKKYEIATVAAPLAALGDAKTATLPRNDNNGRKLCP